MRDIIIIAGLGLVVVLLSGCGTTSTKGHTDTLTATLTAGRVVASGVEVWAVSQARAPICYGAVISGAALDAARDAASSWAPGGGPRVIPGLRIDYRRCETPGGEMEAMVSGAGAAELRMWLGVLLGGAELARGRLTEDLTCEERAVWAAAVVYLRGASEEALSELAAPDGVVEIAAVAVDLEACQ